MSAVTHFSRKGVLITQNRGVVKKFVGKLLLLIFVELFIMVHKNMPAPTRGDKAYPRRKAYHGPYLWAVSHFADRAPGRVGVESGRGREQRYAPVLKRDCLQDSHAVDRRRRGLSAEGRARVMSTSACRRGLAVLLLGACAGAGSGEKLCNMPETGTLQAGAAASTKAQIRCGFLPRWWRNRAAARPGRGGRWTPPVVHAARRRPRTLLCAREYCASSR